MSAAISVTTARRSEAAAKSLRLLQEIASTALFRTYSGHFLLAFWLVGATSRSHTLAETALSAGRERAAFWVLGWPKTKRSLTRDTLLQEVIACHAATQLGVATSTIRHDLSAAMRAFNPDELLYYDPRLMAVPDDVPDECGCGRENARTRTRCAHCHRRLDLCSRYEIWYYALMSAFFCECQRIPLGVSVVDVLRQAVTLRPLPSPDTHDFYQSIYATTHLVYALSHYGRWRLRQGLIPHEFQFLKAALHWALTERQPDTVGEIVDTLVTLGVDDRDPMLLAAREFLLESQESLGGWACADGDDYAYFHAVWTGLDGLREYRLRRYRTPTGAVLRALGRFACDRSSPVPCR